MAYNNYYRLLEEGYKRLHNHYLWKLSTLVKCSEYSEYTLSRSEIMNYYLRLEDLPVLVQLKLRDPPPLSSAVPLSSFGSSISKPTAKDTSSNHPNSNPALVLLSSASSSDHEMS